MGQKGVRLIVMGNPLHMSGKESRQAEYTREFAERLRDRTGIPIEFWDERLTSVEAGRVLRESGIGIEKRAAAVDKLSAVLLLESYLDFRNAARSDWRRSRMIRRVLLLLIFIVVAAAAFAYWAVGTPYQGKSEPVFIIIEPGTPTQSMARMLANAGVIRSDWSFLVARALNPRAKLQAGEYRFERATSTWDVYNKIARGDIFYYELRVPEGANMFDIAAQLEQMGLMKRDAFLNAARNTQLIRDIAPAAPSLEGYLFPSTYRVARHTTANQITREMTTQFRKVWDEVGGGGTDVNRTVTLASLVEKETAVPSERPAVASVYHNRLRHWYEARLRSDDDLCRDAGGTLSRDNLPVGLG